MGIRVYKPTSAGRRNASVSDFAEITDRKKRPEKSLTKRLRKTGGRNNQGKITARHRGGGHKRLYRVIDFKRVNDAPAKVLGVEYDPNRSARIALIEYEGGEKAYILAPQKIEVGATVQASHEQLEPNVGNCMPLSAIPLGTQIHCIEMQPGRGGQLCRAAGMSATLNAREGKWAQITLPSGEVRRLPASCRAVIGVLGNTEHHYVVLGKAGRKRWMGRRPHVRGTVMNPVAHPMGGGEGRNSGGRHPCSPNGVLAKGGSTRKRRKASSKAIVRRRRTKRHGQLKT